VLDWRPGQVVRPGCAARGSRRRRGGRRRPVRVAAARLNAVENDLALDVRCADLLDDDPPEVDVVLAGDVFYDAAMSARVQPWLLAAASAGAVVVVGDPGRHYLPRALCTELASVDVPTTRALEGVDVKTVRVYALGEEQHPDG
jgi:predicted nicotinamide N-methyase